MKAALRYLKSEREFRQFPARRFVNFDFIRPPSSFQSVQRHTVLGDGTMVWRVAESDADMIRGEPLLVRYPDIEKRLAAHPFLKGLTRHHIELSRFAQRRRSWSRAIPFFLEGEPANGFYLIETGKVVLEGKTKDGTQLVIDTVPPENPSGGRGYSRRISGIILRAQPSNAGPSASLAHCWGNIAMMILLLATSCLGAPARLWFGGCRERVKD